MQLKTIKLAGFKSFVDPTTVLLQSHLTAIVGPNGCGKSNIVDAIRWVIGESSARQLRGELLTDVIFNGTASRKPVSQASIELLFDNSQGRWGGAYAQYGQIAIRREILRDGQSQFYLNGSHCRRRDITDIFLGTGLGASNYAIIEQGTITKFFESKPEELRVHLEEAAGISKYRERRRETENRIKATRENLSRLSDLRQEIAKQLEHLKRQANAAERYKALKQEQRGYRAQWHVLHYRAINQQLQEKQQVLQVQATQLEAKMADYRRYERDIEVERAEQNSANEAANAVQAQFYALGADIARQEQSITHIQERERQLTADIRQLEQAWQEADAALHEDQAQLENLELELEALRPQREQTRAVAEQAQAKLQQAENQLAIWQEQWEQFQTETAQINQQAQVEQTRLQHLSQRQQSLERNLARAQEQMQAPGLISLPGEITQLAEQTSQQKQQLDEVQAALNALNEQIQLQRQTNRQAELTREQSRQTWHQLLQQQTSLEALQQAALGKSEANLSEWLKQQGWQDKPRLLESLRVQAGWEDAVETVLAAYLEAICVDTAADIHHAVAQFTEGKLALFNPQYQPNLPPSQVQAVALANKIQTPDSIRHLLAGIYAAETLAEALDLTAVLAAHESVITKEGYWLGATWLRFNKNHDPHQGVLQRKQALENLNPQIQQQEQQLQEAEHRCRAGQETLAKLEEQRDSNQRLFRELSAQYHQLHAQWQSKQTQLEQLQKRYHGLQQECQEQQRQLLETQAELALAQQNLEQALAQQAKVSATQQFLVQRRDSLRQALQQCRQQAQTDKQVADEHQVRVSSLESQYHYLQQNIVRAQKQLSQLTERREDITTRFTELKQPLPQLQESLQALLTQRLEVEKTLANARENVNQLNQKLRSLDTLRVQTESEVQAIREILAQIRIDQGSLQAHQENHREQVLALDFAIEPVLAELPEEANLDAWQERLNQIEDRIRRLGAINLAAIDEYNVAQERKTYLDSQDQDLSEALATLEEAIRKIDRESRERLQATFDRANAGFKELFTKVFEGGHAELELTGDELLNAGVVIRAQPPGKRNALLHLLSGGEKALTAIALVFALFQLNPAPFCVLDEVDAPLDEANVRRFCRLVESMSASVQFIFITHNKVTMEMAKQLIGITMQEPGVSRLVSVDIDQAIAMADS